MKLGAFDFVMKPAAIDELMEKIRQAYEKKIVEEPAGRPAPKDQASGKRLGAVVSIARWPGSASGGAADPGRQRPGRRGYRH